MPIFKLFCDIIFKLYLYADMTKMIHYSTKTNSTHELADKIRNEIIDFADDIAEQFFGLSGNPKFTDFSVKQDVKSIENLDGICNEVSTLAVSLKDAAKKVRNSEGIQSSIDDFVGKMSQARFLSTFDKFSK